MRSRWLDFTQVRIKVIWDKLDMNMDMGHPTFFPFNLFLLLTGVRGYSGKMLKLQMPVGEF